MKTLQNDFTTVEQSKRLLELGVPADSADCYYSHVMAMRIWQVKGKRTYQDDCIPCWSVGRLMEIYDICNDGSDDLDWLPYNKVEGSYVAYVIRVISGAKRCEQIDFSKLEK